MRLIINTVYRHSYWFGIVQFIQPFLDTLTNFNHVDVVRKRQRQPKRRLPVITNHMIRNLFGLTIDVRYIMQVDALLRPRVTDNQLFHIFNVGKFPTGGNAQSFLVNGYPPGICYGILRLQ